MFLSEWREFPSAPCLAGRKYLDDSSRPDVVEIARVPVILPNFFFLSGRAKNLPASRYTRMKHTPVTHEMSVDQMF